MSPRKQAALLSLTVGSGMLVVKSIAYLLTHSSAVFSDALESVVHIGAIVMTFYSVVVSSRPPDESHPYGHGKIEFFSAGIEGALIAVAAIAILIESFRSLIYGKQLAELGTGIGLILFASVVNLGLGLFLVHRGKETSSIALVASGKHMLTDSYTSFGVVLGLALVVATGIGAMDPLVAIAVASNILYSGYKLVRTSVGGLMDEADAETLEHLGGLIDKERKPEWISIHHLRALRSGDHHHIDFHLTIPFYWSVEQGHQFQQHVGNLIAAGLPQKSSVMIHVDPCAPDYCRFCRVNPCTERKSHFVHDLRWDVRTLTGNPPIFDPDEQ